MKEAINYSIGFKGKHKTYSQSPLIMIIKEYLEDDKVVWAEVIFSLDWTEFTWKGIRHHFWWSKKVKQNEI